MSFKLKLNEQLIIFGTGSQASYVIDNLDLNRDSKKSKKKVERISKQLHPHDDEPDPTANMGNYNFAQMLFAFCLGFVTMFVFVTFLYQ